MLQLTFTADGYSNEIRIEASAPAPSGAETHVAAVVDSANASLTLYLDGTLETARAFSGALSELTDVNNWLGRSQYIADSSFAGSIAEFRLYSAALSGPQVALSFEAGPDPEFLDL